MDPLMGSIIQAGETGASTATGGTATTTTAAGGTTATTGPGESADEYADSLLEITQYVYCRAVFRMLGARAKGKVGAP